MPKSSHRKSAASQPSSTAAVAGGSGASASAAREKDDDFDTRPRDMYDSDEDLRRDPLYAPPG